MSELEQKVVSSEHIICYVKGPLLEASFGLPEIGSCFAYGLLLAKIPLIHLYYPSGRQHCGSTLSSTSPPGLMPANSGRPHGGNLDLVFSKGKGESEGEVTGEVLMINACIIIANIYVYLTTSEHI
ncbi:hypothetical protein EDC04DRAFT_2612575 [Pisolithus marmoratus]|nr:hypothetical protein EDC04DRAFT_2612575 [Pisolithus marmoratus]